MVRTVCYTRDRAVSSYDESTTLRKRTTKTASAFVDDVTNAAQLDSRLERSSMNGERSVTALTVSQLKRRSSQEAIP